jgi:outer membrane biosynthesis protein TonB
MMPSVIPARLQFQCGHAALVTLPRVKGETATQRNDRVAREKTDALARQCDFCAPSVAVVEPQVVGGNGSHVDFALSDVAEPTSATDLAVVVTNESDAPTETEQTPPEAMDTEPAIVVTEAVVADVVEPEPAEPVATPPAPAEPPASVTPAPKPSRKPRARRQPAQPTPPAAPAPAKPARARRAPVRRATPRRAPAVTGQRFVVEYRVDRVLRATNIRDALRQANALGASDVVAITRED